jgi:hypothetical protein
MRRAALSTLSVLLLVCLSAAANAREDPQPSRLEISSEDLGKVREDWYGIYSGENKLGYMKTIIRPEGDSVAVENEMQLKVVTMGEKREISSRESILFATEQPYELLHGSGSTAQGGYQQTVRLEPGKDGYTARITAGGTERTMELGQVDYTLADVLAPEIWFQDERKVGDAVSTRSFSLSELRPSIDTYTVTGLKETRLDGVSMAYYEVALHSSVGGDIGTALIDENGGLVSGVLGGAFELRRETAETATDFDYSADVYLLGLAEIDRGLGDPREVSSLVMEIAGTDLPEIPNSTNQVLAFHEESETWTLSIGQGSGQPQPASPEDIETALRETVEHPIYDPRVVELALEVTEDADSRTAKVRKLVHFVDRFVVDSYSAEPLTVLDMLANPKGDCTEHALLFSTLARAIGIPTREVTGLLYLGDDVQAFGGHAWNEVVIDGHWTPIDSTWGETEINATHIRLGTRVGDDAALQNLFADYSFRLVEVDHY